jgi:hypothetical protein
MNDGYAVTDFEDWSPRLQILSASRFIQPQSMRRFRRLICQFQRDGELPELGNQYRRPTNLFSVASF